MAGIPDPSYRPRAKHGFDWLQNAMWDRRDGGFFWQVEAATKEPSGPFASEKHLYGEAFGIYAAATVQHFLEDPKVVGLTMRAFEWLDTHAHDAAHGGYFEQLTRDGKPIMTAPRPGSKDAIGTEYGLKSMNSHI